MESHISLDRELDVLRAVDTHLREAGYELVPELRIRTWRPDLVAVKEDEILIVEVKGKAGDLRRAVAQTAIYASDATAAYLAVPSHRVSPWLEEAARILGVGLLAVDDHVRTIIEAKKSAPRPSFLKRVRNALTHSEPRPTRLRSRRWSLSTVLKHRDLLELLLLNPSRRYTVRELSLQSGVAYSTTWRVVEGLKSLGVVYAERVGPSQQITLNDGSPMIDDLRRYCSLELAPHRAAARDFAKRLRVIPSIRKVILFGSVAEGREEVSSDVDIAVLNEPPASQVMDEVFQVASEVQDTTGMRIVPLRISPSDLEADTQLGRGLRAGEVLFERN